MRKVFSKSVLLMVALMLLSLSFVAYAGAGPIEDPIEKINPPGSIVKANPHAPVTNPGNNHGARNPLNVPVPDPTPVSGPIEDPIE